MWFLLPRYYWEVYFLISKCTVIVWLLFLSTISSLIALWPKNILWKFLGLIPWPNVQSFCESSMCTWKDCEFCPSWCQCSVHASSLKSSVSLLGFLVCFPALLVTERSLIKSPKMIVDFPTLDLSISIYFEAMLLCTNLEWLSCIWYNGLFYFPDLMNL